MPNGRLCPRATTARGESAANDRRRPLIRPPDSTGCARGSTRAPGSTNRMARILVIDDDLLMQQTIKRILERDAHEIFTAEDGEAGVSQLKVRRYDLVITDIMMPRQEGIETIRSIREEARGMPILAISGGGSL